ncbi:hypothetical protein PVAP13_8NG265200 [Panicum virgatum]|uniref:Uncharacterized protein n=1 Tax=Panicum virgatum TaxID=38727 RepID=A0A8T0P8R0_PANVG|nr:hypothetical protein PVAP13_8NG265200 [Panicum virgatum]
MPPTSCAMTSPAGRSVVVVLGDSGGMVSKKYDKYGAGIPCPYVLQEQQARCNCCDGEDGDQAEGRFLRQEVLDLLLITATCSPHSSSVEVHTPSLPSPWTTSSVHDWFFSHPI